MACFHLVWGLNKKIINPELFRNEPHEILQINPELLEHIHHIAHQFVHLDRNTGERPGPYDKKGMEDDWAHVRLEDFSTTKKKPPWML